MKTRLKNRSRDPAQLIDPRDVNALDPGLSVTPAGSNETTECPGPGQCRRRAEIVGEGKKRSESRPRSIDSGRRPRGLTD